MNPDPLHVSDPVEFEWDEPVDKLPRRRDFALIVGAVLAIVLLFLVGGTRV
jgi:hypothetical protein